MGEDIVQKWVLRDWIKAQNKPIEFAEIGVWKGHTTKAVCKACDNITAYWAVDPWNLLPPRHDPETGKELNYGHMGQRNAEAWDGLYEKVAQLMLWFPNLKVMRMKSEAFAYWATRQGRLFDLIFIDADHYYDAVKRDIDLMLPLIKPGGTLSGHDIWSRRHP